jgi:hypothetical protein
MRRVAGGFATLFLAVSMPLAVLAAGTSDPGWSLDALMDTLRQVKSASARFTEHKHVQMLTQPVEASGTLNYVAPGLLEKTTEAPSPESIVLRDDMLSGTRSNGEHYSVGLADHPDIAALVEGVRSTLAGDLPTLRRYYTIGSAGTRAAWQLLLTPKDDAVRAKVDMIRITGADATLQEIDIHEVDGDFSEMFVTPAAP